MAKTAMTYRCTECGWTTVKWAGRCGECQEWGTVAEASAPTGVLRALKPVVVGADRAARAITDIGTEPAVRRPSGIGEFDRVLGGGIVPGAAVAPPVKEAVLPRPVASIPAEMFADQQPTGKVTKVPVPAATHLYVQLGAFSKLENAKALQAKVGGDVRIVPLQRGGQTLYRVRSAPFTSVDEADAALARITGAGANDAHIVVDQ